MCGDLVDWNSRGNVGRRKLLEPTEGAGERWAAPSLRQSGRDRASGKMTLSLLPVEFPCAIALRWGKLALMIRVVSME
jgi:hypothetical protein